VTDDARQASSAEVTGALGPNRAMANLRTTSRFDFQMDVCKDFKETGYCGFGDSCKFLHDRSDYKTGWELEREWNKQQRKQEIERIEATRKNPDEKQQPTDEKEFCTACKNIWADCSSPSCVTSCGHYFCEQCFLSTSVVTCVSCRKPTHGIFNAV
jgi:RING finger protein 113A